MKACYAAFCLVSALTFCLCPHSLQSQTLYFDVGWNQSFGEFDSLNFVIQRYNDSRTFLEKKMRKIHLPNDFCFGIGGVMKGIVLDLSFVGRSVRSRARGEDAFGNVFRRDVKFRMNTINLGLGIALNKKKPDVLGISLDIGGLSISSRIGPKKGIRELTFSRILTAPVNGSTLFFQFVIPEEGSKFGIMLRPYFQIQWFKADMYNLNVGLNPVTYQGDPQKIMVRPSNFGLEIAFISFFALK